MISSGMRLMWILMYSGSGSFVLRYMLEISIVMYFTLGADRTEFQCILIVSKPADSMLVSPLYYSLSPPAVILSRCVSSFCGQISNTIIA